MKHLLLTTLLLLLPTTVVANNTIQTSETTQNLQQESALTTTQINSSYTSTEKKVRNASVKVITSMGHGSGSIIKYKDMILILTAYHVADGSLGQTYLISTEAEQQIGILIYSDPLNDIALIYPTEEFVFAKPMKWKTKTTIGTVGELITYSGYPSWHSLLSFRGNIAGYETLPGKGQQIILQTYGYFGSSGSVIYDSDGYIIGVLWGIDVQREGVHENIVWVSPIQNLNIKLALEPLCVGMGEKPKACR